MLFKQCHEYQLQLAPCCDCFSGTAYGLGPPQSLRKQRRCRASAVGAVGSHSCDLIFFVIALHAKEQEPLPLPVPMWVTLLSPTVGTLETEPESRNAHASSHWGEPS